MKAKINMIIFLIFLSIIQNLSSENISELKILYLKQSNSTHHISLEKDFYNEVRKFFSDKEIKLDVKNISPNNITKKFFENIYKQNYSYIIAEGKKILIKIKKQKNLSIPIISTEILLEKIGSEKNLYFFNYNVNNFCEHIKYIQKLTSRNKIYFLENNDFFQLTKNYKTLSNLIKKNFNIELIFVNVNKNNFLKKLRGSGVLYFSAYNLSDLQKKYISNFSITNDFITITNKVNDLKKYNFLFAINQYSEKNLVRHCISVINKLENKLNFRISEFFIENNFYFNKNYSKKINFKLNRSLLSDITFIETVNKNTNILKLSVGIEKLLRENKNLDIAKLKEKISTFDKNITKSKYYPELSSSLNETYIEHERSVAAAGLLPESKTDFTIQFSNIIFSDKLNSSMKIQDQNIKLKKIERKSIENELTFQFLKLYFEYLKLDELKSIQKHNTARIKSHIDYTKKQFKAGLIDEENVFRWETELGNSQLKVEDINIQEYSMKKYINYLLNNDLNKDITLEKINFQSPGVFKNILMNLKNIVSDEEKVKFQNYFLKIIYDNNSEIKNLKELFKIKQIEKKSICREYYIPEVGFGVTYERIIDEKNYKQPSTLKQPDDNNFSGQISLNLPLFDGFRKENRIKKINDEIKIIKKQDYLIKTNLKKNLSNILNDLSRIQDKIVWAEYSKNNAEKAYKKILDKYKKGLIDIISLVDFQNALLICENQIIINEYDFLNKIIELYYLLNCTTDFKDKNLLDEMWNLKKIY